MCPQPPLYMCMHVMAAEPFNRNGPFLIFYTTKNCSWIHLQSQPFTIFFFCFVIQQENERLKNGYLVKRRSASSDRSMAKPQVTVKRHGSSESYQLSTLPSESIGTVRSILLFLLHIEDICV